MSDTQIENSSATPTSKSKNSTAQDAKPMADAMYPQILDQARTVIRHKHYSIRTEVAYLRWIRQFVHFNETNDLDRLNEKDIHAFLHYLTAERRVTSSTQNQALYAILFFYREVLRQDPESFSNVQFNRAS